MFLWALLPWRGTCFSPNSQRVCPHRGSQEGREGPAALLALQCPLQPSEPWAVPSSYFPQEKDCKICVVHVVLPGWSRKFQHMLKLLVNLPEFNLLSYQNVMRCWRVVVAALRHCFLSNTEKSMFSRVVYFLHHFFWSSSCVSMGSSLLRGF